MSSIDLGPRQGIDIVVSRDSKKTNGNADAWPEPVPLPDDLPAVDSFDAEMLPPILRAYVEDIAERMQCPQDYPAVALIVALSSIVGRRCGIKPKQKDDWTVIPNLWGAVVGRPGVLKSPALDEALKALKALQARAASQYETDLEQHQASGLLEDESAKVARDVIRKLLKNGKHAEAAEHAEAAIRSEPATPTCRRYIVNDTTVEKLGELLNENPRGLLLFRDELVGFFRTLERQGHESDRAFFLECWNGNGSYTYDRIGRGTIHIPGACLSILGGIQPGPLMDLVRELRGSGDDGFLQRFQLAVWPDSPRGWKNIDREPNFQARDAIHDTFAHLDAMTAESLGADPGVIPVLRFDDDAQQVFDRWREDLELRLRDNSEHPAMEAHLSKYRSLVPSLALLIHLTEHTVGPVALIALERALAWAGYLESHARRIYAPAMAPDLDAARLLAAKINDGSIETEFSPRDVYRHCWSGLGTRDATMAAIRVLEDYDWLRTRQEETLGRAKTICTINPACLPGVSK